VKKPLTIAALAVAVMSCCWATEADDALEAAQKLAAQGKYDEALQKHIWYHKHALDVDRAQYGVRLSFALMYWAELGKKYPPALKALREIRDEDAARLKSGEQNRELFHDIVAINEELGDSAATAEVFKKIELAQPTFASSIAELADKALFEAKEYQLEKKYLGDPFVRFAAAKRTLDFGVEYAKGGGAASHSRPAFDENFTRDVVRLIVVLDKTGDHQTARQIQTKALAASNNKTIQNATSQ
jgi:tetratricopeptide (TPR) repeat protein